MLTERHGNWALRKEGIDGSMPLRKVQARKRIAKEGNLEGDNRGTEKAVKLALRRGLIFIVRFRQSAQFWVSTRSTGNPLGPAKRNKKRRKRCKSMGVWVARR